MINVLPGRHVGVVPVARRSSRLVPLPWVAAQPRALVQLVHLLHALGGGPSSHALAKHDRPAPPRRARPTRRVPLRSQAVRLSTGVRRGTGHASGFGQGALRALRTPRPPGCALGLSHSPAPALAAASRICKRCLGCVQPHAAEERLERASREPPRWGWGGRLRQKASPGRHAHAPRHPNRPPLNPALSGRLADGCPLVPPPIFRCLLFYEKSRGNSV